MRTNRRRIMKLISSYERMEYIESNGSSYIDTGIYGSDSLDIEFSIYFDDPKKGKFFLVSRVSPYERTYAVLFDQSTEYVRFDYNNKLYHLGKHNNKKITIKKSGLNVYVDNVLNVNLLDKGEFTTPYTLLLLGILQGSIVNATNAGCKIYFLKMTENGMLVRDFIPVKRKSDGVIGLYDLVGRKFYTSPNGVAFTGG